MKLRLFLIFFAGLNFLSAQDSIAATNLKTMPVLWQQTAAEYRALCYQAFNLAKLRIDQIPKKDLRKKNLAVVTDLDETILDNSYAEAQLIKNNKQHTYASWKEWTSKSMATAVPGAAEFLQYAKCKGLTIFYISNRDTADVSHTLVDLKRLQLPDADASHCLFLSNTASKEVRRDLVRQRYKIALLLGDNLNDFNNVFERKTVEERLLETDKSRQDWGRIFIVLPNGTYGEWENALYNYRSDFGVKQKLQMLDDRLKGY